MKILFTQDALVNAGAERSHLDILSRFSKEVDVGFVYFYPKHDLKEDYERAGIRLFFLDIPETYHFTKAIFRLVRLIRSEKPDLLVSSLWRADIITRVASLLTGVPLVGTLVNDSYSSLAWTDKKGLKYKLVYWLDRLTSGIPIHWIANAQALVDSHVKTLGLKREKISVVYRGRSVPPRSVSSQTETSIPPSTFHSVSPQTEIKSPLTEATIEKSVSCEDTGHGVEDTGHGDQIPPRSVSSQTGMQSFQTETSPFHFISYGRLLERKGFQDAIQAYSEVVKTYPDCTLTIFGEGPFRKELEKLIQGLGLKESVFLPGKIPNPIDVLINGYCIPPIANFQLPASTSLNTGTENCQLPTANCLLKSAHCFLFPSWYEGFSGALVEAMMAGIPIIASDIPMNLEAVKDQESALIFPVRNVGALVEKMNWAINHPEEMFLMGQQANQIARDRFDINKIAAQYEQVLKAIHQKQIKP